VAKKDKKKKIGAEKEHQRGRVKSDGTKFTHLSYYSLLPLLRSFLGFQDKVT
jgi:hypothetical protein